MTHLPNRTNEGARNAWRLCMAAMVVFGLVQAVTNTGLLQTLSMQLYGWFGAQLDVVSMNLLAGVGLLSSVLANTPVVAAAIVTVKGNLVPAEVVPEAALSHGFTAWPLATLPVFVAMMFRGYARRKCNADRRGGRQPRRNRRRKTAGVTQC